ncbi:MAG: hypothetical protein ABFD54_06800 [Armatimonadota bacterium]|nr:hypothetical protein [bacterium]
MKADMFWLLLTAACLIWYSTVAVYVAIKGAFDIKSMLARLGSSVNDDPSG